MIALPSLAGDMWQVTNHKSQHVKRNLVHRVRLAGLVDVLRQKATRKKGSGPIVGFCCQGGRSTRSRRCGSSRTWRTTAFCGPAARAVGGGYPRTARCGWSDRPLAARCVLPPRDHGPVRREEVRVHGRPVAVLVWEGQPQARGGELGSVPDDQRDDLAGVGVEGRPDPADFGLRPHKAP